MVICPTCNNNVSLIKGNKIICHGKRANRCPSSGTFFNNNEPIIPPSSYPALINNINLEPIPTSSSTHNTFNTETIPTSSCPDNNINSTSIVEAQEWLEKFMKESLPPTIARIPKGARILFSQNF
ncbi:unnamed protein product [Gordionus sp. m RMFG-2023]